MSPGVGSLLGVSVLRGSGGLQGGLGQSSPLPAPLARDTQTPWEKHQERTLNLLIRLLARGPPLLALKMTQKGIETFCFILSKAFCLICKEHGVGGVGGEGNGSFQQPGNSSFQLKLNGILLSLVQCLLSGGQRELGGGQRPAEAAQGEVRTRIL